MLGRFLSYLFKKISCNVTILLPFLFFHLSNFFYSLFFLSIWHLFTWLAALPRDTLSCWLGVNTNPPSPHPIPPTPDILLPCPLGKLSSAVHRRAGIEFFFFLSVASLLVSVTPWIFFLWWMNVVIKDVKIKWMLKWFVQVTVNCWIIQRWSWAGEGGVQGPTKDF